VPAHRADEWFDIRLCEGLLERAAAARLVGIVLAGTDAQRLPLAPLKRRIESVVVIGDTGCRMTFYAQQGCNDPGDWPFARVARLAAQAAPDLVIHVGDYLYREFACPDSEPACAGSPWGDRWPAWREDFFAPAQPLLAAAPWVALRGNHENCARAGQGWLHFLALREPGGRDGPCRATVSPETLDFDTLSLLVLDSASTEVRIRSVADTAALEALCRDLGAFRHDIAAAPANDVRMRLLLLHHPAYMYDGKTQTAGYSTAVDAAAYAKDDDGKGIFDPDVTASRAWCAALARADAAEAPKHPKKLMQMPLTTIREVLGGIAGDGNRAVIVTGHEHNFQSIFWRDGVNAAPSHQIIVGNSGTLRSPINLPIVASSDGRHGKPVVARGHCLNASAGDAGNCVRANFTWKEREQAVAFAFGYLHLQRVGVAGWQGVMHDVEDRAAAICGFPVVDGARSKAAIVAALVAGGVAPETLAASGFTGEGCAVLPL
jgi:hypothetical protein